MPETLDPTDPDLTPAQWAAALSPAQLADQLRRLAASPHCMSAAERNVVLARAAEMIES